MVITSGRTSVPLARLEEGAPATWFLTRASPLQARKRWIAGTLVPVGRLIVDDGAERALRSGKSLLPAGVVALDGSFGRGDPVSIVNRSGQEFARGLVAYDRPEADRIIGRKSKDIEALLGYRGRDEMVHRDDLVILESSTKMTIAEVAEDTASADDRHRPAARRAARDLALAAT